MATTRFSKPWPCADILLGATLSLWRGVHCERLRVVPCTLLSLSRGKLPGSGVFEACRGRAAGMPRRRVVGIGVGACCVHAWRTCVSRGRRGTPGACPRSGRHWRVDLRGRCGETCIWTLVRVRFTWQVWGKVGIGGVANVDSRGRHGEA